MQDLLNNWLGWLGLGSVGLAGIGGLLWFTGMLPIVGAALNIFNTVLAVIAPVLTMAVKAITDGLTWAIQYIFWPGLKDVLDSWATTVFVVTLVVLALLAGMLSHSDARVVKAQKQMTTCIEQQKQVDREDPPPGFELPWPFKW